MFMFCEEKSSNILLFCFVRPSSTGCDGKTLRTVILKVLEHVTNAVACFSCIQLSPLCSIFNK